MLRKEADTGTTEGGVNGGGRMKHVGIMSKEHIGCHCHSFIYKREGGGEIEGEADREAQGGSQMGRGREGGRRERHRETKRGRDTERLR